MPHNYECCDNAPPGCGGTLFLPSRCGQARKARFAGIGAGSVNPLFQTTSMEGICVVKSIISALFVVAVASSGAVAMPAAPLSNSTQAGNGAPLTIAYNNRHRGAYRPGGHYRSAPRGWHRFHARPRDWRTRGCVVVGPVWFCP